MDDSISDLTQQAISAALCCNWEEALTINSQIIATHPKNVEALNRLGRAYFELGNYQESKKYFQTVTENDPYNQIAAKFIKRIETFSKKGSNIVANGYTGKKSVTAKLMNSINTDIFLEEPGKTKVIGLLKVAEPQKLSLLSAGVSVNLIVKNRCVVVTDQYGEYLGILPDDLAHRLIKLIHGGNKYEAYIKNTKTNGLTILIREVYRSIRFRNQPSFLDGLNTILTYSSEHIVMADDSDDESSIEEETEEETV